MAESTLSLGYPEYRVEIGKFLGWGSDPAADWDTDQTADAETLMASGYRQVLFPPIIQGERVPHRWRFLDPTGTLTTVADQGDYDLPDDFDGLNGPIRYNDQSNWGRISITSRDHILALRQTSSTGQPSLAALTPRIVGGILTARWTLMLWPTPAGAYGLIYGYRASPVMLTAAQPYPVGGVGFGELVLESILSICEERMNDQQGVHRAKFMERLTAAIMDDRVTKGPHTYGVMQEPSTEFPWTARTRDHGLNAYVYYNDSLD